MLCPAFIYLSGETDIRIIFSFVKPIAVVVFARKSIGCGLLSVLCISTDIRINLVMFFVVLACFSCYRSEFCCLTIPCSLFIGRISRKICFLVFRMQSRIPILPRDRRTPVISALTRNRIIDRRCICCTG